MKAKRFEQIVASRDSALWLRLGLHQFFGEKIDINHSNNATLRVDHGKGKKLVENEKLAGFEHGRGRRNRGHATNHDFFKLTIERSRQKTPRRQNAGETAVCIN